MSPMTAREEKVLSYFDGRTLTKGRIYFHDDLVAKYTMDFAKYRLTGKVIGSRAYDVAVQFSEAWREIKTAYCTCPVYIDCKHTAALTLAFLADDPVQKAIHGAKSGATTKARESKQSQFPPPLAPELRYAFNVLAESFSSSEQKSNQNRPAERPKAMAAYRLQNRRSYSPVEIVKVALLKNGSFGAVQFCNEQSVLDPYKRPAYITDEDVEIIELAERFHGSAYGAYNHSGTLDYFPDVFDAFLRRVLRTGRSYLDEVKQGEELKLGEPLRGRLGWQPQEYGQWRLGIELEGYAQGSFVCLPYRRAWYANLQTRECGPIETDIPGEVLDTLTFLRALSAEEARTIAIPLAEMGLNKWIPAPPVEDAIEVRLIEPTPTLALEETGAKGRKSERKTKKSLVLSANFERPANSLVQADNGKQVYEKHDEFGRQKFGDRLRELGFIPDPEYVPSRADETRYLALDDNRWLDFSEVVSSLREEGWNISAETEQKLAPIELDDGDLQFEVEGEDSWWFSLSLHVNIEGERVPLLPALLSAIRRLPAADTIGDALQQLETGGRIRAMLPDGRIISLPFDRLRTILIALHELLHRVDGDSLKASALHAAQLFDDSLSRAHWIGGDKVRSLVDRLRRLESIEPVEPPKNFNAQLRNYQLDGLAWLQFLAKENFAGLLADDMGLGKTVQLLAHIGLEKEGGRLDGPFLVVCPTSVLPNWLSEAAKFTPHLKVVSFHGQQRSMRLEELKGCDIVVTTYPIVLRDIEQLEKFAFHGVALDEAQAVKNASTKLASAVRRLKSSHRFCLTGTPVENHLGELWSQFNFLLPGMLGDKSTFDTQIRQPIERDHDLSRLLSLRTRIRPFLLRRTKDEVATELPEKTEILTQVELDAGQSELYETVRLAISERVREEIAQKGFKQSQIVFLDALLKLRQVCCDPRLVKLSAAGKAKRSAKLDTLVDMLLELTEEGRKILVFSQFTSMLALISTALTENSLEHTILTGDTKDRKTPVEKFQNGEVPIFLISLKAGGTGLNLTAADTVIHYDPWWNPAVEQQATDRAHRIGQTKKVFVYKLIAQGTIEQRMVQLQERKKLLAQSIYHEDGNASLAFTEDDLDELLKPITQVD